MDYATGQGKRKGCRRSSELPRNSLPGIATDWPWDPGMLPVADYSSDILIGRTIAKGCRSLDSEQIRRHLSYVQNFENVPIWGNGSSPVPPRYSPGGPKAPRLYAYHGRSALGPCVVATDERGANP